ncbi:MAG: tellurite resistance protein TerC [Acidobacteriota bacterium]|jgi:tellurite resistance protein TerC|nr:tellurite resistance protein TerC [Acidobacteriota bacterium]
MDYSIWAWAGFGLFILSMLALDLGVLNRTAHVVRYREAAVWSVVWVLLAFGFASWVFWSHGSLSGKEFVAGYLIELSLSVDNLFVFLLIFSYFKVPAKFQHRVLFWGVLGALVMRITMIGLGAALIERFHWILYVFGVFLIYTGLKMLRQEETDVHPEDNPIVRFVARLIPISRHYEGERFFTVRDGRKVGTLLLLVLVIVEITDLVFAVDSIPAIFGITTNTFIVYTSNVFAILGLRSLYFLLAGFVEKFHHLKLGLSIVLAFVGVKMLTEGWVAERFGLSKETIITGSLCFVALILLGSVAASLLWPRPPAERQVEVELPEGFDSPFDDDQGRLGGDESGLPE